MMGLLRKSARFVDKGQLHDAINFVITILITGVCSRSAQAGLLKYKGEYPLGFLVVGLQVRYVNRTCSIAMP